MVADQRGGEDFSPGLISENLLDGSDLSQAGSNQGSSDLRDSLQVRSFQLIPARQIRAIRPRPGLIGNLYRQGELVVSYGPPGAGKTFLELSQAISLVSGQPWHDHRVSGPGTVVYVMAEGVGGLRSRVAACLGLKDRVEWPTFMNRLKVVTRAVPLLDSTAIQGFTQALQALDERPVLIVFDTFARCFVGGDENSSKDMTEAIHACDRLREEFGCAIKLVHHSTKDGGRERGSSVLWGAADVMFRVTASVSGSQKVITLKSEKEKEGPGNVSLRFRLDPVDLGPDPENPNELLSSCRVVPVNRPERPRHGLDEKSLAILQAFSDGPYESGFTGPELLAASKVSESTFYRRLKKLIASDHLTDEVTGMNTRYLPGPRFGEVTR